MSKEPTIINLAEPALKLKVEHVPPIKPLLFSGQPGDWVSVRVAGEEKTYLGVLLGEMTRGINAGFDPKEKTLVLSLGYHNPAMWVPDLKRVVMGSESWWGIIQTPEQLKQITDQDIENVWYVRALKELTAKATSDNGGPES